MARGGWPGWPARLQRGHPAESSRSDPLAPIIAQPSPRLVHGTIPGSIGSVRLDPGTAAGMTLWLSRNLSKRADLSR